MTPARLGSVLFASVAMAAGPAAFSAAHFDISAGNGAGQIEEFIRQSNAEVSYRAAEAEKYTTRPVKGEYEPLEALRLMFEGIGLLALPGKRNVINVVDCATSRGWRGAKHHHSEACRAARKPEVPAGVPARTAESAANSEPATVILVTGSLIRRDPLGEIDPSLITIYSADMERKFDGSIAAALQGLPAVHGSGPTEDTYETGTDAPTNSGRGIGTNLRGFGAGATLVLVNGHRIAASGTDAAFVDVSNLSSLFVDRIDLLADAASAVYGADAVGGVVNVFTRRDFSGALTRARFGGAVGEALDQWQVGQLFGGEWSKGHAVFGVDLGASEALASADRRRAKSDLRSFGGDNFDIDFSNPGNLVMGADRLAIPHSQDGTALTLADLIAGQPNLRNVSEHSDVIAAQERRSAYTALHYEPNENLSFDFDAHFAYRQARAAAGSATGLLRVPSSNPFGKAFATDTVPALVAYDFYDDLGRKTLTANVRSDFVTLGFDYRTSGSWVIGGYLRRATERQHQIVDNLVHLAELDGALADSSAATAFNPFGDGSFTPAATLERIRTTAHTFARSRTGSVGLDASGALPWHRAHDLRLGLGLEYRDQALHTDVRAGGFGDDARYGRSRDVLAFAAELDAAIVPRSKPLRFARRLDLAVSGRYEDFLGSGHAFTPRVNIEWTPHGGLTLFGNWSRSVRQPPVGLLVEAQNGSLIQPLSDPGAPGDATFALFEFGKNAQLEPETAKSWSAGLRIAPPDRDVALRLSYFNARIGNRIESTAPSSNLLSDADLGHLVTRSPTVAQRQQVCDRTRFHGRPEDCMGIPIGAIIDLRLRNIAVLESRGIEVRGSWKLDTTRGTLGVDVNATRLIDYEQAQTPRHPLIERVDTQHQPLDLRIVTSLQWQRGGLDATASVNVADGYRDRDSRPERSVDSWTTWDASLAYAFDAGLSVSLVGENLFNQSPPFLNNPLGVAYDAENADIKGRRLSVTISKAW